MAGRTTRRPQTPELLTAAPEELVLDSLVGLLPYLGAVQELKAHLELVALELQLLAQTELQVQDQEHVPEEPEEPEEAEAEEPQAFPQLAALAEPVRSFCTGRSETLCLVIF